MSRVLTLAAALGSTLLVAAAPRQGDDGKAGPIFQLRVYTTASDKLPVLLERFEARNLPIFARHGITLVGAWTPAEEGQGDRLVYLVRFPDREAADRAWSAFGSDPEWKQLFKAEKATHGTVVERAETTYLDPTAYSPEPELEGRNGTSPGHVYELRTYTASTGKLGALNDRFRRHTIGLFRKHGLDSVLYTTPTDGERGAAETLVYFLRAPDLEAAKASWTAFRADPAWQEAKRQSETGGVLAAKVESLYLTPTSFSPLK